MMGGLLDAYQDSTDTTLRVMASQPLEPEKPKAKHSAWSAIPRALAAGAAEIGGNVIDSAAAFGQVAAASGGLTPGFDPDLQKNRAASLDAAEKLKTEGIDWRTEESRTQYDFARDLRPDPATASTAENLVFGLTKGLTKAVGSAMTMGPVGGALAFGTSEGMTAADDLAAQGVDQATRTKVGAVTGVLTAAGVALPVAGNTLAKTAGLVVTGGPASFIAQQLATREILKDADYHTIAQQYDPLDPVGLAIATFVPAGFAAAAMRGARASARPLPDASPVRAADDAAVTPEAVPTGSQDAIDAAMVQNITALADARPAMERRALLQAWDEVHQNPIGPANDPLVRLTPDDVAAVLVSRGPVALKEDGVSIAVPGYGLVKFIWKHGPESNKQAAHQINAEDLADLPLIMRKHEPEITSRVERKTGKEFEQLTWVVDREDGRRIVFGTTRFAADGEHHLVTVHVDSDLLAVPSSKRKEPPSTSQQEASRASRLDTAGGASPSPSPEVDGGYTRSIGKGGDEVTPDLYRARVEQLKAQQPDLIARIGDDGQPVRLADELEAIRKQAQEGTETEFGALDAPLLKVAAECAIATGTAGL